MISRKNILLVLLIASVSCNTKLPEPKQPSKLKRIPINKTVPIELESEFNE